MNWPLLQNSLLLAGTTTALAVGFGLLTALWAATLEARWRNGFLALAIVALALPPFLVTNCWISLLGEAGSFRAWVPLKIYSLGGTIWILALLLWPITLLAALAAWRRLEAAQFECEPGMTGYALLRWLLLPAAKGELALATVLTFVLALNNFAVPAILQTKVLPDEMWVRFNTQFDAVGALKLSVPLVIAPVGLLVWAARRNMHWPHGQGSVSAQVFRRQLGAGWWMISGAGAIALVLVSVGIPVGQIALARRTWAELGGAIEASTGPIWNSFWLAAGAATVVVGTTLLFCRGSAEVRRVEACPRGLASVTMGLSWLLFFIPGVLLGIALIKIFNRPVLVAFYQSAGICLLALVIRYLALALTAARHAVASVDPDLVDMVRLEGASRGQLFRLAVWPQIAPQIFAAWYVVYLLCLWDVESIVLVQPPGGETLALRIFNLLHYGHAAQVNALCLTLLGVAVLPLAGAILFTKVRPVITSISRNAIHRVLTGTAVMGLCICAGCGGPSDGRSARLPSRFFERAEVIGTRGVGVGEFNKPRSVTVDRADNLYVVDITGRVQRFSPAAECILSWQMQDIDRGRPKGMCCDTDGNIVVGEPHYQRINHFTPEGQLVRQWGVVGTNGGELTFPRSEAVNSRGELLLSEYTTVERLQRFRLPGARTGAASGPGAPDRPHLPSEAEPVNQGQSPVITDPLTFIAEFGRPGTEAGEFNRAEGICVDAQDRIYVADSCNHRIQIFSREGQFLRQYGHAGTGLGQLSYPYDIKVDAHGNQFVCEFGNSRIQVFDADCRPVEIIGGPGAAPGRFANPWSVALDSHGNLYVADSQNHRVQKLVRRAGQLAAHRTPEPLAAQAVSR